MRALSPGPVSARLLAAGVGQEGQPWVSARSIFPVYALCLLGHRPRYLIEPVQNNFHVNNNNNDDNNNDHNTTSMIIIQL